MTTTEQPPKLKPEQPPKPFRSRRQSSPVAVIAGYVMFAMLGGALIAPRLYVTAQFLETISYRFSFLADRAFHHFVTGSIVLLAVVAFPWLAKNLGPDSSSVPRVNRSGPGLGESFLAFGWSFVPVAVLACVLITFEARTLQTNHLAERWIRHLRTATLFALVIGILSELVFRGALFGALRQRGSFSRAALLSSVVYALIYFVDKPQYAGRWVQWSSGLAVLAQMFHGFTELRSMLPPLVNLILFGTLLAAIRERTGSLLPCIALHAGVSFWVKTLSFTSNPAKGSSTFWGTDRIFDGWIVTIVLSLIFLLVERTSTPRKSVRAE